MESRCSYYGDACRASALHQRLSIARQAPKCVPRRARIYAVHVLDRYSEDNAVHRKRQGELIACEAACSDRVDLARCLRRCSVSSQDFSTALLLLVMIPDCQANRQSNILLNSRVLIQPAFPHCKALNGHQSEASTPGKRKSRRLRNRSDVPTAVATTEAPARPTLADQFVREGSYESPLVQLQVRQIAYAAIIRVLLPSDQLCQQLQVVCNGSESQRQLWC